MNDCLSAWDHWQDPVGWSAGCSMAWVNAVANMWACPQCDNETGVTDNCKPHGAQGCPLAAAGPDGTIHPSAAEDMAPLCDKTIGDDAVAKVQLAASWSTRTGRPWFLAAGFRKPRETERQHELRVPCLFSVPSGSIGRS